jgi:hypothetical protein
LTNPACTHRYILHTASKYVGTVIVTEEQQSLVTTRTHLPIFIGRQLRDILDDNDAIFLYQFIRDFLLMILMDVGKASSFAPLHLAFWFQAVAPEKSM